MVRVTLMFCLCVAALAAGPMLDSRRQDQLIEVAPVAAPDLAGCVPATDATIPAWPEIRNADARIQATYRCAETLVSVDVAIFANQRSGKEAVSAANRIVNTRFVSAARPTVVRVGEQVSVHAYRLDRNIQPALLWSWYAVNRTPVAGPVDAKLLEAGHAALFRTPETAIFTVTTWAPDNMAGRLLERVALDVWHWYLQQ